MNIKQKYLLVVPHNEVRNLQKRLADIEIDVNKYEYGYSMPLLWSGNLDTTVINPTSILTRITLYYGFKDVEMSLEDILSLKISLTNLKYSKEQCDIDGFCKL